MAGTPEAAIRLFSSVRPLSAKYSNGLPIRPPMDASPNVSEYPQSIQIGPTTASAPKLIIIMFRTVLERVIPP